MACGYLGINYMKGSGVAKDLGRATELLGTACLFGHDKFCALRALLQREIDEEA